MSENTGYVHKTSEHDGDEWFAESVFPETRTFTLGSITAHESFTCGWAKKLLVSGTSPDEDEYYGVVMATEESNLCWEAGKLGEDMTEDYAFDEVSGRSANEN